MPLLLFFIFILLPIAELYVIIQVGQEIGVFWTLVILLADGFIGAALARSQGALAWRNFNQALAEGRMPAKEIADGAMIMFGGALLLSPGFLSDVLGIFLLLPPGRAVIRAMLKRVAKRTPQGKPVFFVYDRMGSSPFGGGGPKPGPGSGPGQAQGSPFGHGPPPGTGQRPGPQSAQSGSSSSYDVEGTAREIDDDHDLPRGSS